VAFKFYLHKAVKNKKKDLGDMRETRGGGWGYGSIKGLGGRWVCAG
jgi:hypothetical protein